MQRIHSWGRKRLVDKCQEAGWLGHVAALCLGAAASLASAPAHLDYLGMVCVLLLLYLLRALDWREGWLRGSCYGLGLYLAGTYWIFISVNEYGNSSILAGVLVLLGLSGLMGVLFGAACSLWCYLKILSSWRYLILFPACWVLGEWLNVQGQFPWMLAGYAHLETPLGGWAPVFGTGGIGFAVAASAGAGYCLLSGRDRVIASILLVTMWGGGAVLARVEWTQATDRSLRVAMVQPDIPLDLKFDPVFEQENRALYESIMKPLWGKVDLVVLPETAFAAITPDGRGFIEKLASTASANNTALVTGFSERDEDDDHNVRYHNAARALGNESSGVVRKRHLVPFGEFVPLERWLRGLIPFFDLPLSNFSRGADKQMPLRAYGQNLDTFICYEIIYPDLVSENTSPSGLLLTISEDAWFGDSSAPHQHLHMAQMRSLETGREMVRVTNRGISATVDHRGQVRARTSLMKKEILVEQVAIRSGMTPFVRWGSDPVLVLCALVILLSLWTVNTRPIVRPSSY